jgi:hypothetical protein
MEYTILEQLTIVVSDPFWGAPFMCVSSNKHLISTWRTPKLLGLNLTIYFLVKKGSRDYITISAKQILYIPFQKPYVHDSYSRSYGFGSALNDFFPPLMNEPIVVWTPLDPLPRWVPGPTTRWAPGTTRLALHGT